MAMTKAKRVMVAEEVLKILRIRTNGPIVATDNYFRPKDAARWFKENEGKDMRDVPLVDCQVCALGACMLAKARLWDKVPVNVNLSNMRWDGDEAGTVVQAEKVFGEKQAEMIENAFEVDHINREWEGDRTDPCITFGRKYKDPKKRLAAIMRNIIKNEGVFKP